MAPPSPPEPLPPLTVRFEIAVVLPEFTVNTRVALLPLIIRALSVGPLMLTSWLIVNCPPDRPIVDEPMLKVMVIVPHEVSAFASSIAARRVQLAPDVA